MVNALTWAEEPLLRDAFFTLINQRSFRAADAEQRLPRLFERSELEAEEVTEALGTQVRRSVELLVQSFSEARLAAAKAADPDPLTEKPDDVYQAAVTVMMRIVFLLFAEERDMLPSEKLYWDSYAIKDLLDELRAQAAGGEEQLDETYDAWHRLLAVSHALHGGVNYDEMRMPAYGGSLLDPERFPWLHATDARGLRLKVSDRVMLHVLESVQTVVANGERRRISFREIDVEQIGYIYEGLLGYSCAEVTDDIIIGLVGKYGEEPEMPLGTLNGLYDEQGGDSKRFAAELVAWVKENQPAATGKTTAALVKLVDKEPTGDDRAELVRLLTPAAAGDRELLQNLISWGYLIRRDLRNIPLVFPVGGLVVVETPSRRNAGAHYTPRSLAEEVVLHALQPLVYEPGPLQSNDEKEWRLKSAAAMLDLKVADIAAGSGAFLVAAARFLSERLVEAWIADGMLGEPASTDAEELRRRALREVIARCLYGADINPMAVEMCKLSLWLVSMDKTKPFSFVDDKIFCGNALLGLTSLDQLRYLHVYPEPALMDRQVFVDVDEKIVTVSHLRRELANPVEEHDPMRSARGKARLLEQIHAATNELRLIADGVIAAGLPLGGKPGRQLNDSYKRLTWEIQEAFPQDDSDADVDTLCARVNAALTPTVETDYERWIPLHWVIEAPDVVVEHGGFDAVIGNPPFLGGKKVSNALGSELREFLINVEAQGVKGNADLAAYFFLRAASLLNARGSLGLIATNTIAQGDTREVGLDLLEVSENFRRAVRSRPWPSALVQLEYAALWTTRLTVALGTCDADGVQCARISSLLEPEGRTRGNPVRLAENQASAAVGSNVNGVGFVLSVDEAAALVDDDPVSDGVVRKYMRSDEVNGSATHESLARIIDFGSRDQTAARAYAGAWHHVERRVMPYRATLTKKPKLQENWWLFERGALALYDRIANLDRVIALVQTSKTQVPVLVPSKNSTFTHKIVVFSTDSFAELAILTSSVHWSWTIQRGSTMKTDPVYTPTDVYQTFPRPGSTEYLDDVGEILHVERRAIMVRRNLGLTALYNLVNDPNIEDDADVTRMREIHVDVDVATMGAYGWDDVPLDHGFHTYRQMERWTVSSAARVEILDRLLEENHRRARAEGQDVPDQSAASGQDTLFA